MTEEIRQNGCTVLASCSAGKEYRDYIRYIALGEMGFKPGRIELYRDGELLKSGYIPKF